ncbi:MFS transporter [Paenibacillus selenitireducens]|uniref:MFS transporter n=1 Tax=Paenibacillus selenitireducens TaxID=1324314 RepID=A0A1T2X1L1_9BACL|nr:MFS transporter [Paenibacillus selenitireducens]OPA73759.1 MFS transporter [Paenibacillus selenitireducens]
MKWLADFKSFFRIQDAIPLIVGMFLYGIGMGILAPMNAVYMRDAIGLSKLEITSIFSISLLLNMITTIVVGLISDKIQRKKTLPLVASLLCIIGLTIYMQASTYALTLVGMVLAVAPSGLIMGQLFAMARKHFMRNAASFFEMAQIWLRTTYSVGFFSGLLIGANLYILSDFRGILWGNLLGYVLLFTLLLIYKEQEETSVANVSKGEPFSLVMLIALLLLSCGDALRGLYLPLVVVQKFGEPQLMSYLWSVQAVFELLFMTLAGYWAAKYGSKRIIFIASLFALVVYITYSLSPPLYVFFMVQPLYSFYVSVLYGVAMGYVQRMFHTRIGFGSSLYVFLSQTASLIGYLLPFLIPGYQPAIFVIPAALVVSALVLMPIAIQLEKKRTLHNTEIFEN